MGRSDYGRGNYGRWDDQRWSDRDRYYYSNDRQDSKNTWRNLGILGGVVGIAGLLSGDDQLAAIGLGGGLYSAYRYEEDRKSENRWDRNRYELYRHPSFDYRGHHYIRRERERDGQKYFYFEIGR